MNALDTNADRTPHRLRSESGYAFPVVVFLGLILVTIAAVIVGRGLSQSDAQVTDARFDQAFHAAEGGADTFLVDFWDEPWFVNHTGSIDTRDDAIEAARALAAADPSVIIDTAEGEAVAVRPDTEEAYYTVGFMPSIDDSLARVRVVRTEFETEPSLVPWRPKIALLFHNDALISGQVVLKGPDGNAHSNGSLDVTGKMDADDCVTATGEINGGRSKVKVGNHCPEGADAEFQPPISMPVETARNMWKHAEYQLCPGGMIKAGPAHPVHGHTAEWVPCEDGAQILGNGIGEGYQFWRYLGRDDSLGHRWIYSGEQPRNGMFYIYQGSAVIDGSPANWYLTLVAEAAGEMCEKVGGDIAILGNIGSYPSTGGAAPLAFLADRDLSVLGNKNAVGVMVAREQLLIQENPAIDGSLTAVNECDSPDSLIHENEVSGNPVIRYDADMFAISPLMVPEGPPIITDFTRGEL